MILSLPARRSGLGRPGLAALVLVLGCAPDDAAPRHPGGGDPFACPDDYRLDTRDFDGDGQSSCDGDCVDTDATVHGMDLDGDGSTPCDRRPDCDETDWALNQRDEDLDGFTTCDEIPDCDDTSSLASPGNERQCGDGVDSDCDGFGDCRRKGALDASAVEVATLVAVEGSGASFLGAVDVNGDGVQDIHFVPLGGPEIYFGPLEGTRVDVPDAYFSASAGNGAEVAELDGDGVADLVFADLGLWPPFVATIVSGPLVGDLGDGSRTLREVAVHGAGRGQLHAEDADGDGSADLIIGNPSVQHPSIPSNGGCVYIERGPIVMNVGPEDVWSTTCSPVSGQFGAGLSVLADLDGTGLPVLLIGAPGEETVHAFPDYRDGRVYLVHPVAGVNLVGDVAVGDVVDTSVRSFAATQASDGDLDGDGYDDIAFASRAPDLPGVRATVAVRILHGSASPFGSRDLASEPDVITVDDPMLGLSSGGDFDGNGYGDLLLGVALPERAMMVLYGPFAGQIDALDQSVWFVGGPWLGWDVTAIDDLDGNGTTELLIGDIASAPGDPILHLIPGVLDGF